jgi:hypothetical protein
MSDHFRRTAPRRIVLPWNPPVWPLLALTIAFSGCANNPDRLPELDRRFYYNLPTPEEQKEFLRLRDSQRQAFLEQKGLWQKWTALSARERDGVAKGEVEVGFKEFAMLMAWGRPADTQVKSTEHRQVEFHTFIRCTSGPRTGRYVPSNLDCDGTSSETLVAVENGIVTEIKYPN